MYKFTHMFIILPWYGMCLRVPYCKFLGILDLLQSSIFNFRYRRNSCFLLRNRSPAMNQPPQLLIYIGSAKKQGDTRHQYSALSVTSNHSFCGIQGDKLGSLPLEVISRRQDTRHQYSALSVASKHYFWGIQGDKQWSLPLVMLSRQQDTRQHYSALSVTSNHSFCGIYVF